MRRKPITATMPGIHAVEMLDCELGFVLDSLREIQARYQIPDWEAFIVLRKPDNPGSYIVKCSETGEVFAKQIAELHRGGLRSEAEIERRVWDKAIGIAKSEVAARTRNAGRIAERYGSEGVGEVNAEDIAVEAARIIQEALEAAAREGT